jgi:hypothetical protein
VRILFAILTLIAGLALVFGGYRVMRIVLPIYGFVAGLGFGAAIASDMSGTPFLGGAVGITVGLLVGFALALVAYLWYYAAVVILVGMLGYWAGESLVYLFGLDHGFISVMLGLAGGIALGIAAVVLNAPKYLLIGATAVAGAITAIGGLLLLFNKIPLDYFSYNVAHAAVSNSAWWMFVGLALAATGIATQYYSTRDSEDVDEWALTGTHHHPTSPTASFNG